MLKYSFHLMHHFHSKNEKQKKIKRGSTNCNKCASIGSSHHLLSEPISQEFHIHLKNLVYTYEKRENICKLHLIRG